jgi:hypothetical protein
MASKDIKKSGPIQGKVAGILTERELTINIGSADGVHEGMKFKVLADMPIEVRDPQTGEKLGEVDREKVRIAASEVREKFSVCRTYRKWGTPFPWYFGNILSRNVERYETLKAQDSQLPAPLSEDESYIKKGDRVIELVGEEDEKV